VRVCLAPDEKDSDLSPILVLPETGEDTKCVIMPMRI
jgi:hypothetical protein